MAIFKKQSLRGKSLLQKLFRQEPIENAIISLNNLLAEVSPLTLTHEQLNAIESKYKLKLSQAFPLNLQEFYIVHWNDWLKTGRSDAPIQQELDHLASLFDLNITVTDRLIRLNGEVWYGDKLKQILNNRQVSAKDEADLAAFAGRVKLSDSIAAKMYDEERLRLLGEAAEQFIQRERLSPSDETMLRSLASDLRLRPNLIQPLSNRLLPFKQYWQLENGPLPVIETAGPLQKNEICHFYASRVSWMETRAVGRGFSQLEQVNFGTLYLTNKRLVFEGQSKNSVLSYDRISRIGQRSEGIQLYKDKGKDLVLKLTSDQTSFHIIIQRLATTS